jgi:hypothetical protein
MMTENLIQESHRTGSDLDQFQVLIANHKEYQLKDYGEIEMVFATGENSELLGTCLKQIGMKVIGRTLKKNVV